MTPSEAYASLHQKWPELRPRDLSWDSYQKMWYAFGYIGDWFALSACFVACLEACAKRDLSVKTWPRSTELDERDDMLYVNENDLHSIASVMDRVMQLPEVPRA